MRQRVARALVLITVVACSMFIGSKAAMAGESIPELQWPAVKTSRYIWDIKTSPIGVTSACTDDNGILVNLKTISNAGQVVRELNSTEVIDERPNCIYHTAVDKNGDLYGRPYGRNSNGSWGYGTNLLAYNGNTLKWKYDVGCTTQGGSPVVGADGNIYAISGVNGSRLIGLTSEVELGTVQPKKTLDVALSGYGLCSAELYAVKDGIIYASDGQVQLYSYSGKKLGKIPSGMYLDRLTQINAEGRAFYPIYVGSGSTGSIKIAAYNLFRNAIEWTAPESLFRQNPWFSGAHPTPDGGVLVKVRRLKTVGGFPTNERVYALIKLNALGFKIWEKDFPNQDAAGNPWDNTYISVDMNGKVAIVREGSLETNDPYNRAMPAISIGILDSAGDVVHSEIMHGNLDKQVGGVNGYYTGGQGYGDPILGPNTLYVLGVCKGACVEFLETKLYAFKISGLGLDYPRGAIITRSPRAGTLYSALGDSYSSGEGVPPFEANTDLPGVNTCHRSEHSYARLLSGSSPNIPSLGSNGFRACSGATTESITDVPQWNESIQLDLWPDPTTQLVTLTIGGNDIKFADFAKACVVSTCQIGSPAHSESINQINALSAKLAATYRRILEYAPNADIYVLGYPQVIANKAPGDPFDVRCAYMHNATGDTGAAHYPWEDAWAARDIVTKLNVAIRDTVLAVSVSSPLNSRLHYVAMDGTDSPFIGHEICGTGASWFQNVNEGMTNLAYVFHPNMNGHVAYAAVAKAAIDAE